ncbi:hypothetical protein [Shinella kummerowiae]|uniref:hypothetical protein n=1 Tax=Shinella kummerowiae TaxID=417745 RepID=UPI001AED728A|nr:hypothetical protein [Shinella kummerowiae]
MRYRINSGENAGRFTVGIFSGSEEKWQRAMETDRRHRQGLSGVVIVLIQDLGPQPSSLNPFNDKDDIGQLKIERLVAFPHCGRGGSGRRAR